jgi:hypothetical protein
MLVTFGLLKSSCVGLICAMALAMLHDMSENIDQDCHLLCHCAAAYCPLIVHAVASTLFSCTGEHLIIGFAAS